MNLLPWRKWQKQKQIYDRLLLLILPVCLGCMIGFIQYQHLHKVERLASLRNNQQLITLSKLEQQWASLNKLSRLEAIKLQEQGIMDLVLYLGAILPKNMHIQSWDYQNQLMQWQGAAFSSNEISQFIQILRASSLFQSINLTRIQNRDKADEHDFVIQAELKPV